MRRIVLFYHVDLDSIFQSNIQIFDISLQPLQLVDYENDLDFLVVTEVHQEADIFKGTINLYNNETGEILKEITLKEPWLEVSKIMF